MCLLDLSKVLLYEIHYDYIKNKYGNKSRLLFTDSDSLMYEVKTKTEDGYQDFSKGKKVFDSSNYSTKSKFYDDSKKLVVAKMNVERAGVPVKECWIEAKDEFVFGNYCFVYHRKIKNPFLKHPFFTVFFASKRKQVKFF